MIPDDQSEESDYLYKSSTQVADDPAGNNDTHFVQKLEELGWIELQDLIEKLGEPL